MRGPSQVSGELFVSFVIHKSASRIAMATYLLFAALPHDPRIYKRLSHLYTPRSQLYPEPRTPTPALFPCYHLQPRVSYKCLPYRLMRMALLSTTRIRENLKDLMSTSQWY